MNLIEAFDLCPHLASPAHLAIADTDGKYKVPAHIAMINRDLLDVAFGNLERVMFNLPFQHGKSWLVSKYFPAWTLLLFPETRILLAAHEERFASSFGSQVKEVISKFGAEHGIVLKKDTKAKGEWVIEEYGGGMVCRGMHGSLQGRPADLFIIEDPLKDAEQAVSPLVNEKQWEWYQTVAYSRLGPTAPVVMVTTRWTRRDLCGRILAEARDTKENWKVVKFPAIALENDILGRKPGEPLWPERVPLKRLQLVQAKRGRWFSACYQQEPEDEEGNYFKPRGWPFYSDTGDAYSLQEAEGRRTIFLHNECVNLITVDWAYSEKKGADFTALGVFVLTPDGRLLILDVQNRRLRPEQLAPAIALACRQWRPFAVAIETGHPTLEYEYRRFPEIPDVRWMKPESKSKLMRALPAIMMGENKRIYLPGEPRAWIDPYCQQLSIFTGLDDERDDMVDMTAQAGTLAQELRMIHGSFRPDCGPDIMVAGKEAF